MFSEGSLVVDETYQRRSVWSEKDKIRLIETVLLNLIIPVLFFGKQRLTLKQVRLLRTLSMDNSVLKQSALM